MDKPSIIIITLDEFRRDTLSYYGNRAISTPNIDGLYPHRSGAYSNFRKCPLDENVKNLFKELRAGGYQTALFGKCHFAPVPYRETRPDITLPYDEFRDYYLSLGLNRLDLQDDKQVSIWFYDDYSKALDKAVSFVKNNNSEKPLFSWISFSGPHYPFDSPSEYFSRVDRSMLWPRKTKEGELSDPGRIHHKSFYGSGNIDGASTTAHTTRSGGYPCL
jgi:arylsulfatase A-like enzyme